MTSKEYRYQENLLQKSPILMDADHKKNKVDKMLAILDHANLQGRGLAVDVGCSVGFFCKAIASQFEQVVGLDIDQGALEIARQNSPDNVRFDVADSMALPFPDSSVDLLICNHVYEHVPDAEKLFDEIFRVLSPQGACYLGAASRLTLIEPHYHLPFLSWLPKPLAHRYMQLFGKGSEYYENLRTYWGIRRLVSRFELQDFTLKVITEPDTYCARDMIRKGGLIDKIPRGVWQLFYALLPSYIFILRKPT
ncbi:MAG: class I SAM-dependent methyltransferase [Hahellaceae bacterium]|nr:class I SAM-dependent methyltransferase [Hahellaceae bacterium]